MWSESKAFLVHNFSSGKINLRSESKTSLPHINTTIILGPNNVCSESKTSLLHINTIIVQEQITYGQRAKLILFARTQ